MTTETTTALPRRNVFVRGWLRLSGPPAAPGPRAFARRQAAALFLLSPVWMGAAVILEPVIYPG